MRGDPQRHSRGTPPTCSRGSPLTQIRGFLQSLFTISRATEKNGIYGSMKTAKNGLWIHDSRQIHGSIERFGQAARLWIHDFRQNHGSIEV